MNVPLRLVTDSSLASQGAAVLTLRHRTALRADIWQSILARQSSAVTGAATLLYMSVVGCCEQQSVGPQPCMLAETRYCLCILASR